MHGHIVWIRGLEDDDKNKWRGGWWLLPNDRPQVGASRGQLVHDGAQMRGYGRK